MSTEAIPEADDTFDKASEAAQKILHAVRYGRTPGYITHIIEQALLAERLAERERCAIIAGEYRRDASFDDSAVGVIEHQANQANIAAAIRSQS